MFADRTAALTRKGLLATQVVFLFLLVEIELRTRPLPAVCESLGIRLHAALPQRSSSTPTREAAMRAARAVARIQRHWPWGGTCLRQSLVLGRLLRGYEPTLVLGVRRDGAGELAAHAWLEIDGRSIDPESASYAVLAP